MAKKNVLIIGAGGVAQVVAHKVAQWAAEFGELHIANRTQTKADAIIAEVNFGADMVEEIINRNVRSDALPPRIVKARATRGKSVRAEPVVALYEQGRVFHRNGSKLADLEDEMLTWVPGHGDSPNRVDALVWAITNLLAPTPEGQVVSARGIRIGPKSPFSTSRGIPDLSTFRRFSAHRHP